MAKKRGQVRRGVSRSSPPAETTTSSPVRSRRPRADSGGRRPSSRGPRTLLYASVGGVLVGVLMVIVSMMSVAASSEAPTAAGYDPTQTYGRELGSPEAPVVITEWIDFQCPACRVFALTREPEIKQLYIDTGQVRLVTRNFAFLGPESILAAEAAAAAADQGRYWDYRNLLLRRQRGENGGAFNIDNLKRFADELGLDRRAFDDALERKVHRAAVLAELKEGEAMGVNATPTVFVNGRKLDGVPTVETLRKVIEEELGKQR